MKRLYVFAPVFLSLIILFTSLTPVVRASESISEKVFRLHIIANSNSDEDQMLKLKVRDNILKYSKELYSGCKDVSDALFVSKNNLSELKSVAQKTIAFYGYEYDARVYTSREYFNTREYGSFTLPAGKYYCLKIIIGEGKGKNWWCVMFPSVCLSGCTDDFDGVLSEEEQRLIEDKRYIVKFKALEIYEYIKDKGRK